MNFIYATISHRYRSAPCFAVQIIYLRRAAGSENICNKGYLNDMLILILLINKNKQRGINQ